MTQMGRILLQRGVRTATMTISPVNTTRTRIELPRRRWWQFWRKRLPSNVRLVLTNATTVTAIRSGDASRDAIASFIVREFP